MSALRDVPPDVHYVTSAKTGRIYCRWCLKPAPVLDHKHCETALRALRPLPMSWQALSCLIMALLVLALVRI